MIKTTETINGTLFHVTRPALGKILRKTGTNDLYTEAYDLLPYVGYEEIEEPINEEKQ